MHSNKRGPRRIHKEGSECGGMSEISDATLLERFREIADALNCPLNTALARMHEGLKRLRLLWGAEHA